ncbi:hypothetical protein MKW98_013127 [Papaver atlanticum]|uniref:Uncharacterized protein n=1 Tax=Papaver atlanticum TaxID=357466 RepID=A0AAD4XTF4_9MAGN|nr:hypothetical protein MKW98_013127 [Papaver atlanticum]
MIDSGKSHFWCWWCCNMIFGGGGGEDFGAGEVMVVAFRTKYWDINNAYTSIGRTDFGASNLSLPFGLF